MKQVNQSNGVFWKKTVVPVFLIILIGLAVIIRPWEKRTDVRPLSIQELKTKTGAECIAILEGYGLVLPEVYQADPELAERSVKEILDGIDGEKGVPAGVAFSYTALQELAEQVYEIVEKNIVQ